MTIKGFILGPLLIFSMVSEAALDANITFGGQPYIERWSDDHQQEYTPWNQPDLDQSPEMLKLHRFPTVNNDSQLAKLAQALRDHYQQLGDVILDSRTISNSNHRVSEQLIVVVSGTEIQLQAQFIRLTLVAGEAMAIVFSKRFEVSQDYDAVRVWLDKYGQESEVKLLSWAEPFK